MLKEPRDDASSHGRRRFIARALGRGPDPATPVEPLQSRPKVALVDWTACVALVGQDCRRCVDVCPRGERGIRMTDEGGPEIQADCDGCGLCVSACSIANNDVSIRLVDASRRSQLREDFQWH